MKYLWNIQHEGEGNFTSLTVTPTGRAGFQGVMFGYGWMDQKCAQGFVGGFTRTIPCTPAADFADVVCQEIKTLKKSPDFQAYSGCVVTLIADCVLSSVGFVGRCIEGVWKTPMEMDVPIGMFILRCEYTNGTEETWTIETDNEKRLELFSAFFMSEGYDPEQATGLATNLLGLNPYISLYTWFPQNDGVVLKSAKESRFIQGDEAGSLIDLLELATNDEAVDELIAPYFEVTE